MARPTSIGYQVNEIIRDINGIGTSKMESRNESGLVSLESGQKISDKVHSVKSLENLRDDLTNLGKFCKDELGIKDMSQIDADAVQAWLDSKDISYHTASNYLSEINKVSEHLSITREEVAQIRQELRETLTNPEKESRAYTKLDKVEMPERSQPAFELQRDYGLRVSAATHINISKQLNGNTLSYREKGGKWSEKQLSSSLVSKIHENAQNGKYELNNRTYSRDLQKAIEKTGQEYNGTHGIRHSYAQNSLEKGATKAEVSQAMGHVREEITNTYLR